MPGPCGYWMTNRLPEPPETGHFLRARDGVKMRVARRSEDWDKARATAVWGVTEGMKAPLDLKDRPHPHAKRTPSQPEETPPPGWEQHHPANDSNNAATSNKAARRSRLANILALVTHINTNDAWTGAPADRELRGMPAVSAAGRRQRLTLRVT